MTDFLGVAKVIVASASFKYIFILGIIAGFVAAIVWWIGSNKILYLSLALVAVPLIAYLVISSALKTNFILAIPFAWILFPSASFAPSWLTGIFFECNIYMFADSWKRDP